MNNKTYRLQALDQCGHVITDVPCSFETLDDVIVVKIESKPTLAEYERLHGILHAVFPGRKFVIMRDDVTLFRLVEQP